MSNSRDDIDLNDYAVHRRPNPVLDESSDELDENEFSPHKREMPSFDFTGLNFDDLEDESISEKKTTPQRVSEGYSSNPIDYFNPLEENSYVHSSGLNLSEYESSDDENSDEEKNPLTHKLDFEALLDQSDLTLSNHPLSASFNQLIKEINNKISNTSSDFYDLLDLPEYKANKVIIFQALQKLGSNRLSKPVMVAAVLMAQENALSVSKAIITLFQFKIFDTTITPSIQKACLSLIDAGEDAKTIASTIVLFNENYRTEVNHGFNLAGATELINLVTQLQKAGIIITANLCMVIAKADRLHRQSLIESLIKLRLTLGNLIDHFYLCLALHKQYQNVEQITDLLIMLNMPLTEEIIDLVIYDGSFVTEITEELRSMTEPYTSENIMTLLMKYASLNELSPLKPDVAVAWVPFNYNLIKLFDLIKKYENKEVLRQCLISLREKEISSARFQLNFALYPTIETLYNIADLLIQLKSKEVPLTNELIDLLFEKPGLAYWLCQELRGQNFSTKIKVSFELIQAFYHSPSPDDSVKALDFLSQKLALPNTMLLQESKNESTVFELQTVIKVLSGKNFRENWNIIFFHQGDILLIDELILKCLVSTLLPEKQLLELLGAYLELKRDFGFVSDELCRELAFIILKDGTPDSLKKCVEDYLTKSKNTMNEKNLPILPNVIWNCVHSYFYAPAVKPATNVDLLIDHDDISEVKLGL